MKLGPKYWEAPGLPTCQMWESATFSGRLGFGTKMTVVVKCLMLPHLLNYSFIDKNKQGKCGRKLLPDSWYFYSLHNCITRKCDLNLVNLQGHTDHGTFLTIKKNQALVYRLVLLHNNLQGIFAHKYTRTSAKWTGLLVAWRKRICLCVSQ